MVNKFFKSRFFAWAALLLVLNLGIFGEFKADASAAVNSASPQSYVVKLNNSSDEKLLENFGSSIRQRFSFNQEQNFRNIFTFESVLPVSELQRRLAGAFEYLAPNREFAEAAVVTNDPGFSDSSQNVDKQWGLVKSGFDQVWTKSIGSFKNVVAVIDTGVDATHEDLGGMHMVPGYNLLTRQDIKGVVNSDDNGHGTLITGILAATANNGIGIVGTNWNVSIMPIKALDSSGKGDSATIAEALVWAVDHEANIINLSLGGIGSGHDVTLANSVSYAFHKGAIIVAPAGNDILATGVNLDVDPVFPICDDNNENMIIGVAATDQNDLKANFSNYGKNCIDVSAPGKRILSTINYDPFTKKTAPNSYAYASGTSLAVPFVSGAAAIIRTLFPNATNAQIRDRIIATADQIDFLNLSQCAGQSCKGLLGTGRINVEKATEWDFSGQTVNEGDVVKLSNTGTTYLVSGGQKRLISSFVYNQRFANVVPKSVTPSQLSNFPDGPYAAPTDDTLVKMDTSSSVYVISKGQKLPITYPVFVQHAFSFSNVNTVSYSELTSWVTGNLLPPVDGSLLRAVKNKTVYWVVGGILHPINWQFYIDRGLNIFPVLTVADSDIANFSKGEAYIR